jgi:phospholipid-transporting ATPase
MQKIVQGEDDLKDFNGEVHCMQPNEHIYEFDGVLQLKTPIEESIILDKNSFLLRGCSLKQTKYILGIVVYIGHNSKIMKNSPSARTKTSKIEDLMNFQILIIFIIQIIICTFCGLMAMFDYYGHRAQLQSYIYFHESESEKNIFYFLLSRISTWILIFNNFVPISLLVTLEMVKFIQGMFMSWDVHMYDRKKKLSAHVQTSTLNEELGQVEYIFSDKTGTLTQNYMEFKKMSIGSKIYGEYAIRPYSPNISADINLTKSEYIPETEAHLKSDRYGQINNFNFFDSSFNSNDENNRLFLLCMAMCHTVIIHKSKEENEGLSYMSSSPDEEALVNAARAFNFIFKNRDNKNKVTLEINGEDEYFLLLNVIEYTSERKKMSVIVKELKTNKIFVLIKGADSALIPLLNNFSEEVNETEKILYNFACEGLRTLVLAYKELSQKEYNNWQQEYIVRFYL